MQLRFRSLVEDRPGPALRQVFNHGWPGWSKWLRKRRGTHTTDLRDARLSLRRHMPEFERLWDTWVDVCDGDDEAARFLSFWSPPRYLVNCSQAVLVDDDGPLLIRNYDLDPQLNESTLLSTNWRGRRVAGMVDGISGLADGMNDAGLAASLTFGGRTVRAAGFGIPIIIRYILEMCVDVQQAVEALRAVPSHMSYNVTVADARGNFATVYLAPDRPAIVTATPYTTNHQLGVEWPQHGRFSNTKGRSDHLERLLDDRKLTADRLLQEFLSRPLASTRYDRGFGTVYTAAYRPAQQRLSLHWMDGSGEHHGLGAVTPGERVVAFTADGSRTVSVTADATQAGSGEPARRLGFGLPQLHQNKPA
ncbi:MULTISPECIES: C45 family autoproteolytic acyltransferase/hydolase [unclassified Meridianimarinicoccus]|uniref:C45 family autoproteolytic acyltransferase/hydolase n=1 Tax=unclassified Meridianimarinicoccus TaxID=2923344 RepID=UPI001868F4C7|nr:C45 family peptidase [Fluviibacterium sp. MJW13]